MNSAGTSRRRARRLSGHLLLLLLGLAGCIDRELPTAIRVHGQPALALLADGTPLAYVANHLGDNVAVVNTNTQALVATIGLGGSPMRVAVAPDGAQVYATNYNGGQVSVINASTQALVSMVTVGSQPYDVALVPDGSRATWQTAARTTSRYSTPAAMP